MKPYYEVIPELAGAVFESSWIEDVIATSNELTFIGDIVFTESSPNFKKAEPGDVAGFRRAVLRFTKVKNLSWQSLGSRRAISADGTESWDAIDNFWVGDGKYVLEGDFGNITIGSEGVEIEFTILDPGTTARTIDPFSERE